MLQHCFQLVGDGQAEMGGVLEDGEAVVGNRPEDHGGTQHAGLIQYMDVPDKAMSRWYPSRSNNEL